MCQVRGRTTTEGCPYNEGCHRVLNVDNPCSFDYAQDRSFDYALLRFLRLRFAPLPSTSLCYAQDERRGALCYAQDERGGTSRRSASFDFAPLRSG